MNEEQTFIASGLIFKPHELLRRQLDVQHCLFKIEAPNYEAALQKALSILRNDYKDEDGWHTHHILLTSFSELKV